MTSERYDPTGNAGALDVAVRDLVRVDSRNGRYVIDMPLITCGGNRVSVSVWPGDDGTSFVVTDDGTAWFEVDAAGLSPRIYGTLARERSGRYGAVYDGRTMLFIQVASDRLRSAITSMGNLIKEVVDETAERTSAEHGQRASQILQDRLGRYIRRRAGRPLGRDPWRLDRFLFGGCDGIRRIRHGNFRRIFGKWCLDRCRIY